MSDVRYETGKTQARSTPTARSTCACRAVSARCASTISALPARRASRRSAVSACNRSTCPRPPEDQPAALIPTQGRIVRDMEKAPVGAFFPPGSSRLAGREPGRTGTGRFSSSMATKLNRPCMAFSRPSAYMLSRYTSTSTLRLVLPTLTTRPTNSTIEPAGIGWLEVDAIGGNGHQRQAAETGRGDERDLVHPGQRSPAEQGVVVIGGGGNTALVTRVSESSVRRRISFALWGHATNTGWSGCLGAADVVLVMRCRGQ